MVLAKGGAMNRRVLMGAAFAGILSPSLSLAQTLLEDSSSTGSGWLAQPQPPQPVSSSNFGGATASPAVHLDSGAPPQDWRNFLLGRERSVKIRRSGEGGYRTLRYRSGDGTVDREGYGALCFVLRDVRANRMMGMDPALLDVLCGIQRWMEFHHQSAGITVTSGFRSGETNSKLEGAARNSMHLYGKAADIVIEGVSSAAMGAMARQFNVNGGTGIYVNRGFVHVDSGAARMWTSRAKR